jgi:hypothetical protein
MTFISRWQPGRCMVLCVDTPDDFRTKLQDSMESGQGAIDLSDPFALHVSLMDQVTALYDQSVWSIRNLIRRVEKVSLFPSLLSKKTRTSNCSR